MKTISIVLVSFLSIHAFAKDGSSGCGPGWFILKDNSLVSSALRATTNNVLAPVVTIGMTIGTSECTKHKIVLKEKESLHFVTHNFHELRGDIAQGGGTYSTALAQTIGCNSAGIKRINGQLRANYENIYRTNSPDGVLLETYKVILSDKVLTQACSLG